LQYLHGVFDGSWHAPIPSLLARTEPGTVKWEHAYAHPASRLTRPTPRTAAGTTHAVALVGDAAHTHDPLLAQGAGRAIESAVSLAACVAAWRDTTAHAGRTTLSLQAAVDADAALQNRRDLLLHRVGWVAGGMGQAGPNATALRCLMLLPVPASVRCSVFDFVMQLTLRDSIGGAPFTVPALPAAR
jgi:2-polyprenyl-6-methoxyphenol hydroxylase-like FAD-dependent oxidoreductase